MCKHLDRVSIAPAAINSGVGNVGDVFKQALGDFAKTAIDGFLKLPSMIRRCARPARACCRASSAGWADA
jgi:hypothetical protein